MPRPCAHVQTNIQGMCLDKGYDFDEVRRKLLGRVWLHRLTSAAGARRPRPSKEKLGSKPGVGVVERSHSWLNRFRRILVRWDQVSRQPDIAFLHFACALTALRAAGLLG